MVHNRAEIRLNHELECQGGIQCAQGGIGTECLPGLSSVVHITSMFVETGYANGAVSAAIKHAAVGMVKSTALEVGQRGTRGNSVLPYVPSTIALSFPMSLG